MNPYDAPAAEPAFEQVANDTQSIVACPVCVTRIRRLPIVSPVFHCKCCKRRLYISGTLKTRSALLLLVSLMAACYPVAKRLSLGELEYLLICVLGFTVSSTLLLGFFGRPKLKGWLGAASESHLAAERRSFELEQTELRSDLTQ